MKRFVLDARTATDHFPGIGRYVSSMAQAMAPQLGPDEVLLLLHDPAQSSRWQLPPPTPQLKHIKTAVSPFSLAQQWHIPRLLAAHQADVYHSPYYLMPYRLHVPTVLTIYDLTPQLYPQYVSLQARLLFRLTTRLALRQTAHVIAISDATRQDLLAAYPVPPESVTMIPLAPDPRFQRQPLAEKARVQQQYDLPDAYVLYFGINKPHKNLLALLEAWQVMRAQAAEGSTAVPPLVIAGAWDERYPEPKLRVEEWGLAEKVRFLGPVTNEDLPALYANATVFVFPTLYEGFGLPVVEAMACGTAVACSNISSIPQVGGEAVLYFDPHQPQEIARQIGRLWADPTLRAHHEALSLTQAARFSWAETAAETLTIYRRLSAP